ncbi:MAG: GH36-type glycosyl hydrolase domain-containing protein [Pyrinomonadaceae bacterium]
MTRFSPLNFVKLKKIISQGDEPIRAELYSIERLEQFAALLAAEQKEVAQPKKFRKLLPRLEENGRVLIKAYRSLSDAIRRERVISPAAEWLVDNFHIVEEQLREIREDLPRAFYGELPKLVGGDFAGYPRIYAIAFALIAHTDSRLDVETLRRFLAAYQQTTPLKIGELWALAITLRIALVENLRRLASRIVVARTEREEADALADEIVELSAHNPEELSAFVEKKLAARKDLGNAFIVQFTRQLREQDPLIAQACEVVEQRLQARGETTAQVVQAEHQRQAATQVSVGNIITSMRLLSTLDWQDFFESVSLVDRILERDPARVYQKMDFATRDRYRDVVERVGKRSSASELTIAESVVELAEKAKKSNPADARKTHLGFYLIDEGLAALEREFNYRPLLTERYKRLLLGHPAKIYFGLFSLLTFLLVFLLVDVAAHFGASLPVLIGFTILSLIPAADLALSLLNWNLTLALPPRVLPRMNTASGIPDDARAMVVIPTLLTSEAVAAELLEKLEVYYLANQDKNIYFALLGDFADAGAEETAADSAILETAIGGIEDLNKRYSAAEDAPRFHLFHRRRRRNEREKKWMGWERKRGKLHEFNRLLRGASDTSFIMATAEKEFLEKIRYVITLDSDTQLPRDAARKLVGTATHPLNRPQFDKKLRRVTKGYGILQPRVGISLTSANRSAFSRLFSGNAGVDPYTTAASDVYQDLFGEGIFTGKGLYDVDAFESAVAGRAPENSILSHDLFEGLFARCALVTNIELIDDFPTFYDSYAQRAHRWVRGDWQIARWIFPFVPDASGRAARNRLPLVSRWKIFDNLRRSLVAPALLLWLVAVWTIIPGSPVWWTLFSVILLAFPVFSHLHTSLIIQQPPRNTTLKSYLTGIWKDFQTNSARVGFAIVCIAHQAFLKTDAICRTIYRKIVSRRNLLEWTTAAQAERGKSHDLASYLQFMWVAPVISIICFLLILFFRPAALPSAAPFLLLWLASPLIAYLISRPQQPKRVELSLRDRDEARQIARRTWRFFETFVGAEDNWLPPDNFQEDPQPVVAHRTSPTNIGLLLLSTVAARDFGYIGAIELTERLELTLATLEKLRRFRGQFLNWYDTNTLAPLAPQYVSTVDSGNLAGHLLTLKQAVLDISNRPLLGKNLISGLADAIKLMREEAKRLSVVRQRTEAVTVKQLWTEVEICASIIENYSLESLEDWKTLLDLLTHHAAVINDITGALLQEYGVSHFAEVRFWSHAVIHQTREIRRDLDLLLVNQESELEKLTARMNRIAARCEQLVEEMDFSFLLDKERKVFAIGYRVENEKLDNSFYDLLASEARLASFVAIAKGDAAQEHWFRLGRPQTPVDGSRALVSWTGTMFEYLMPILVMRDYDETLLDQTYKAVVERQIEYGNKNRVPWGISEAAYNARDLHLNYQYAPFGIPGLGLKRGLSEDLVVAPYATALAAPISPRAALDNFRHLASENALARYGFYESIDYTPERLPQGEKRAVIRAFMAHHQGMILLALDNLLHENIMQQRFHAEPLVQATELLLQERIPRGVAATRPRAEEVLSGRVVRSLTGRITRVFDTPFLPTPRTQILSNGTYSVMVTTAGAGFSMCGGLAVTRWREDATRDNWGAFIYLRDARGGAVWSAGYQPIGTSPKNYEVAFSEDKIVITRADDEIVTRTEIIVSPEDNAEIRSVSITNHSARTREIEVTSYAEIVLATPAVDAAHPAFSNLSIETEFIPSENSLFAKRRPRSPKDAPVWAIHTVTTNAETVGATQYETDRARFLGRGHDTSAPLAIVEDRPLSNSVGAVLDPIFSLRRRVYVKPHQTVRVSFSTAVAHSREEALALADKYHDPNTFARESALSWTRSQVELRHLNIDAEDAHLFQRLASRIIYSDSSLRPRPHVLAMNTKAQSSLWAYGVSGDLPIVLARVAQTEELPVVRQLLHAHEYLRLRNLKFDLVIMNDHPASYIQSLQDEILMLIRASSEAGLVDQPGGIFLRRADQMPDADRILLHSVARVVIVAERGAFENQLAQRPFEEKLPAAFYARHPARLYPEPSTAIPPLAFFNGLGGFGDGGREYVTILGEKQWTPAPWLNVIANEKQFGFQISETGSGFTWSVNSRENRLTPWSNDAVSDPPGEVIYLRDEDSGTIWTPTPLPIREAEPYKIRHGQGYSIFAHTSHGIEQELTMFAPLDAPVKISLLRLRNNTNRVRKISVTSYNELALGTSREKSAPQIITEADPINGDIFARNPYNNEFAERVAFVSFGKRADSLTCDRKEFIGRNGNLAAPEALERENLAERDGAGLDPCAALQTFIELKPNEEREIFVLLGEESSKEAAKKTIEQYRNLGSVKAAFQNVIDFWNDTLGAIEVKTPDAALDMMVNRWLLYQTLACRIWARSAFYQSGGAFGFRDQLQDVTSLVYTKPEIARAQILLCAAHQFKEGDVQHWWHPPTGRGVRTRISDDLLWLPFVTSFYIETTGDYSVLDEEIPFIEQPLLAADEDDAYRQPTISSETATVFEHCARAIDHSLKTGAHNLPLMGSGDWNDGMNYVGNLGKGESVWMAWFLYKTIKDFLPFCRKFDAKERAAKYRRHLKKLSKAVEANAWDGDWYRRAYFDDGTPLGSVQNDECRIDSIVQSWGVISGAADEHRAVRAMTSVEEYLIKRGDGLVLLFTPPFDNGALYPGYIKGYLPGVRENGGQYTHAAIWTLIAFAMLGDGDRAGELFALLNPINHASTRAGLHKYKVEPFVAAGDVYAHPAHMGRGGWTWYTGSAGWMYRAAIENMLGFRLIENKFLQIEPCIPRGWREFEIIYRRGETVYQIKVENPLGVSRGVTEVRLDEKPLTAHKIPLADDRQTHRILVTLGNQEAEKELSEAAAIGV